jgi:uncharacterized repeat protein (TIGR01451 family)
LQLQDPKTGRWGTRVTVRGQGTYVVDPATGAVTFTPIAGFTGKAAPLPYRARTAAGKTAQSTITPEIVSPQPLLAITTTTSKAAVATGRTAVITLTVANRGKSAAAGTTASAAIPSGFAVFNARTGRIRGGRVAFDVGTLAPGATATRTFVLIAASRTPIRRIVPGNADATNADAVDDATRIRIVSPSALAPAHVTG